MFLSYESLSLFQLNGVFAIKKISVVDKMSFDHSPHPFKLKLNDETKIELSNISLVIGDVQLFLRMELLPIVDLEKFVGKFD